MNKGSEKKVARRSALAGMAQRGVGLSGPAHDPGDACRHQRHLVARRRSHRLAASYGNAVEGSCAGRSAGPQCPARAFAGVDRDAPPWRGPLRCAVFRVRVLAARLLLRAENGTRAVAVGGRLGSAEELRHRRRGSRAARLRPVVWRRVPARDQESASSAGLRFSSLRVSALSMRPAERASTSASSITSGLASSGSRSSRNFGPTQPTRFPSTAASVCFRHHGRCNAGRARGPFGCARLVRRRQPCIVAARSGGAARRNAAARRCGARFGAAGVARRIGAEAVGASRIRWAVSH